MNATNLHNPRLQADAGLNSLSRFYRRAYFGSANRCAARRG